MTKVIINKDSGLTRVVDNLIDKTSIGTGLKFNGSTNQISFGNDVRTMLNNYVQFDKPWSFVCMFRATNLTSTNGQGNFFWGINNAAYDNTTSGFNVISYQNSGVIAAQLKLTSLGWLAINLNFASAPLNSIQILTITNSGVNAAGFRGYFNKTLSYSVASSLFTTSQINYATVNPGITYSTPIFYQRGTIYGMEFYNKELTQSEVDYIVDYKLKRVPATALPNLQARWTFDQKSGTSLFDESGFGKTGTLVSFANTTPSVGNSWVDDLGNSILF